MCAMNPAYTSYMCAMNPAYTSYMCAMNPAYTSYMCATNPAGPQAEPGHQAASGSALQLGS